MHKWRVLIYELVQSTIALMTMAGFLGVLAYSVAYGLPQSKEGDQGMYLLLGCLNMAVGTVVQTYFRQRDARSDDRNSGRTEQ